MQDRQTQIVFTLGPSSEAKNISEKIFEIGKVLVRLNFSWGTFDEHQARIRSTREYEKEKGVSIPIIIDISGPRVKTENGHSYDQNIPTLTDYDKRSIEFGAKEGVDYIAQSFVGSVSDVKECRELIKNAGGNQKIIAKIERVKALQDLDAIIAEADAVMVARGDLGEEVALGGLPFVQQDIVSRCNKAGKPVIVATEMLFSMVENTRPTRAEVTDVSCAVMQGADATMLSDETARGKYPVDAVLAMSTIISVAEKHRGNFTHHPFLRI